MNRRHRERYYYDLLKSQIKWQKIASVCTLFLALSAIAAIGVTIHYNNKLIRESIESRVAENRPVIDIRRYPSLQKRPYDFMYLEIKNIGKGNAYNINYSYHYYDWRSKKIIWEDRTAFSDAESFAILESGKVLSYFTDEDRKRFHMAEPEGLTFICAWERSDEINRMLDSTIVACALYLEYEDYKGNIFWTARQFPIGTGGLLAANILTKPWTGDPADAPGSFLERARERAVKDVKYHVFQKRFDRKEVIQTERLEDTLSEKSLK
jgi:hypothetical protein